MTKADLNVKKRNGSPIFRSTTFSPMAEWIKMNSLEVVVHRRRSPNLQFLVLRVVLMITKNEKGKRKARLEAKQPAMPVTIPTFPQKTL